MITVIIPTRNRSRLLSSCLDSLHKQTLSKELFEIIVIDNGSTDNTTQVLIDFKQKLPNLKSIKEERPGLHIGRHLGLFNAKFDILVYADDDIIADQIWLESILSCFEDHAVAMVGGNNIPIFESEPPNWIKNKWNKSNGNYQAIPEFSVIKFLVPDKSIISPFLIWGCNFAIRKSIVYKAKGFHPDGFPKELLFLRGDGESHISRFVFDNNFRAVFSQGASVGHFVSSSRMTFKYFKQRGKNQGYSDSFFAFRNNQSQILRLARINLKFLILFLNYLFEFNQAKKLCLWADLSFLIGYSQGLILSSYNFITNIKVRNWVLKEDFMDG